MRCDRCGEHEATLFLRVMLETSAIEINLCDQCAQAKAASGLCFDLTVGQLPEENSEDAPLLFDPGAYDSVCPQCGLTAEDLAHTRLLGCATCYSAHEEALRPVLAATQGITPPPSETQEDSSLQAGETLAQLEVELELAVEVEQYDRAAALRDRIRELRQELDV